MVMMRLIPMSEPMMHGGGLVGCETALWLAQNGKDVTIVEALDNIMTGAKVKEYKGGVLTVENAEGNTQINCDSVILSVGYKEENSLYHEVEFIFRIALYEQEGYQ